jgi:hypothetical protein
VGGRRRFTRGSASAHVRALLSEPGERVLAWAPGAGGVPVVASTHALYVPSADASSDAAAGTVASHVRLPYEQVASATWDEPRLDVVTVGPRRRRFEIALDEPGLVPQTVRDRVTASIVVSEHVALVGTLGARVTARRPPAAGGPDEPGWNVVFDPGLDPADPALRAAADAAIARLREVTGL